MWFIRISDGLSLEIGVLCFTRRNITVWEHRLARNNKAPAISRAGRNRAWIVVSYKTFAILREVWLTCNKPSRVLPPAMTPGYDFRPLISARGFRRFSLRPRIKPVVQFVFFFFFASEQVKLAVPPISLSLSYGTSFRENCVARENNARTFRYECEIATVYRERSSFSRAVTRYTKIKMLNAILKSIT